jgi:hypothetical protein
MVVVVMRLMLVVVTPDSCHIYTAVVDCGVCLLALALDLFCVSMGSSLGGLVMLAVAEALTKAQFVHADRLCLAELCSGHGKCSTNTADSSGAGLATGVRMLFVRSGRQAIDLELEIDVLACECS